VASGQELPTPRFWSCTRARRDGDRRPQHRQVLGRVPVGQDPHELTVSPDGKLAFATNYSGQSPGQQQHFRDRPRGPDGASPRRADPAQPTHGLWFADGKLYFTAEGSMAIAATTRPATRSTGSSAPVRTEPT